MTSGKGTWARRARKAIVALAAVYAVVVLVVALGYRWFLYPGKRHDREPRARGAELVRIEGDVRVFALHAPAPAGAPTLVLFHGNGEDLVDEERTVESFASLGVGVMAVEYPGYGLAHDQTTSERSIYAAADVALRWLDDRGVDRSRRVIVGFSLGTGVATEMASRDLARGIVLLAPYTSIPRMVGRFAPIVPVDWLVADRFDSLGKAPSIGARALVVHGEADALIPLWMGERLAATLPSATLHVVPGGHHNDLYAIDPELRARVVAFAHAVIHD